MKQVDPVRWQCAVCLLVLLGVCWLAHAAPQKLEPWRAAYQTWIAADPPDWTPVRFAAGRPAQDA